MFGVIFALGSNLGSSIITNLIQVVVGLSIYGFGLFIFRDEYLFKLLTWFKNRRQ
jgi:hypothetical protein